MKIAHKYHWHYAPLIGPILPDGTYQRWCKWCGFRETIQPTRVDDGYVDQEIDL
jgi:hypothetical protein